MSAQILESQFWFGNGETSSVTKSGASDTAMLKDQTENIDRVNSMMKYCAFKCDVQFRSLKFDSEDVSESKVCFNDCATKGYQMLELGTYDGGNLQ